MVKTLRFHFRGRRFDPGELRCHMLHGVAKKRKKERKKERKKTAWQKGKIWCVPEGKMERHRRSKANGKLGT